MKLVEEEGFEVKSSGRSRANFVPYYFPNNISIWIDIKKEHIISLFPNLCWFYVFEMLIARFFISSGLYFKQIIIVNIEEEEFTFNFSSYF